MNMELHATLVFAQTDSRDGPLPCRSAQFRPGPPRIGGGDGGAFVIDLNMAGLACPLSVAPGCFPVVVNLDCGRGNFSFVKCKQIRAPL
ncbi:hypothetical protein B0T13DRAFT_151722 [Neurospora crassa]|nr:hypothetical protein B0T13DRAFT_151722 [Neurospora crassa]